MLMMVLATSASALATSYVYESCAEMATQEEAQQLLEHPNYGFFDPVEDPLNLDPDSDSVACNNEGNLIGGPRGTGPQVVYSDLRL